jgi:hypothetical protein
MKNPSFIPLVFGSGSGGSPNRIVDEYNQTITNQMAIGVNRRYLQKFPNLNRAFSPCIYLNISWGVAPG